MLFNSVGNPACPTIILLHGGGLSDWSLSRIARALEPDYHVVTPVIQGHGENSGVTFAGIEQSADTLLEYIDTRCNGQVFMLGGLSLGAQIVAEVLSKRDDIARFAIMESPLVLPMPAVTALMARAGSLLYGLISMQWFSKLQARALFVAPDMFRRYYHDSISMSRESLVNITLSNGNYAMKDSVGKTRAKVLVIVGGKERSIMKRSARMLGDAIPGSTVYIAPQMGHGQLSLAHPEQYIAVISEFIHP